MFNPKWVFHATLPPRVVHTQADLDALGDGWANSPAEASMTLGGSDDDATTAAEKAARAEGAEEIKLAEDLQAEADVRAQQALVSRAEHIARGADLARHVEAVKAKLEEPIPGVDYGKQQ